jgi:hypothetical protein
MKLKFTCFLNFFAKSGLDERATPNLEAASFWFLGNSGLSSQFWFLRNKAYFIV